MIPIAAQRVVSYKLILSQKWSWDELTEDVEYETALLDLLIAEEWLWVDSL